MSGNGFSFLRPCLNRSFVPVVRPSLAVSYAALQRSFAHTSTSLPFATHDYQQRVEKLNKWKDAIPDFHPRLKRSSENGDMERLTPQEFHDRFGHITETVSDSKIEVFGRVTSVRTAGSALVFMNVERQGVTVQVLCNKRVVRENGEDAASFQAFKNVVRAGDWYSAVGHPCITPKGTVSIETLKTPTCLSPALHQIPEFVENDELLARRPHVKSMIDPDARNVIILRDRIKGGIVDYLRSNGFIEVETPILEPGVGGANARPFETTSTELPRAKLKLRVAPELSLKRLIVGGQERVFEIGKVFRNEGIDSTHNPEFTICEFYEVGATLGDLMQRTQDLFVSLAASVAELGAPHSVTIPDGEWKRLEFIPTIEKAINRKLPILSSSDALKILQEILTELSIPLPASATVPQLLEELEDRFIQPLCLEPTFVTHHPECLSPLAKSYEDPLTGQRIAARAELHIAGREYVNCYEEENSPFEQRRKFLDQVAGRTPSAEEGADIDESYLEALQWGMPPTGGWGCGVDRLVMLFAGKERITDVLPLGNLRHVVAIASNGRERR